MLPSQLHPSYRALFDHLIVHKRFKNYLYAPACTLSMQQNKKRCKRKVLPCFREFKQSGEMFRKWLTTASISLIAFFNGSCACAFARNRCMEVPELNLDKLGVFILKPKIPGNICSGFHFMLVEACTSRERLGTRQAGVCFGALALVHVIRDFLERASSSCCASSSAYRFF